MVDPITLAAIGAGASGVMGFKGNMAAARNAKKIGEYNAKIAENEKVLIQRATRDKERLLRKQAERLVGSQTVAVSKSGITMEGSPLNALFDTFINTEYDAIRVREAGSIEEANKEAEAGLQRMQANAQATAFKYQALGSLIQGGTKAATLMS